MATTVTITTNSASSEYTISTGARGPAGADGSDATISLSQNKLAGRGASSGTGSIQEITLGTNLSLSGTTLNAAGGAAADIAFTPAGTIAATDVQGALVELDGDSRMANERVPTAAGLTSKFGTNKATLADGDKVAILDSAASDVPKHGLLSAIATYITGVGRTLSGAWAFDSPTRPTSAGTGTPAATSLITLTDTVNHRSNPSSIVIVDDFAGGTTASASVGDLGWYINSAGGGTGAAIGIGTFTFPNIGSRQLTCGNATNAGYAIYLPSHTALLTYAGWEVCFVVAMSQTTDCDMIAGFTKDNANIGIGKFGGKSFGARYSSATDTDFMFFSKNTDLTFAGNDASNYSIDSGVAANTAYHTFRIRSLVVGELEMSIDGGSWVAVTTSGLTTSGVWIPYFYIATRTTASKTVTVDYYSFRAQGVSR